MKKQALLPEAVHEVAFDKMMIRGHTLARLVIAYTAYNTPPPRGNESFC